MRRLFRSRSASDNVSVPSMPPPYQAVEAGTSSSASDSRLVTSRSASSTVATPKTPPIVLAYVPEEASEIITDSDSDSMGYCYYRIYTPDGAVLSLNAFNPLNPYLGRIAVTSVPPPQTVASLRRRIAAAEKLPVLDHDSQQDLLNADGFTKAAGLDAKQPILLNAQIPGNAPYGTTPETAFALLLRGIEFETAAIVGRIDARVSAEANPKYLYYRLFTRMGEDTSKVQFNPKDPALGRIERNFLAPPHSVDSIKHQIARLEGKRIYAYAELYTNISARQPIENATYFLLSDDGCPGCKKDSPMVLVQPERRPKLYNRPIEVILAYTVIERDGRRHLAVGSKGVSDGVLVEEAHYCMTHWQWDCTWWGGYSLTGSRSVTQAFWCEFSLNDDSYKTYLPACNIRFLDE
ncbi:hypothetical protein MSAN_02206600 [Mycena sanguinolenta]|uniref:Uncharacterized protein n=1 Tax=Mycena sanguinolenta TaxID=230812 RepID=A0A8H6XCZ7_9AGAR|nr:hypothetical protein MSAN_02206600 [Mycena sanguinolenta]